MSFHLWSLRNALCHFGLKDQSSDHFQVETPCPPTLFRQVGGSLAPPTCLCMTGSSWTGSVIVPAFDLLPSLGHGLWKVEFELLGLMILFHLQITYLIWCVWHSYFAWVWILLRDFISRPFRSTAHPMPRAVCSKKVCVASESCFGMFILIHQLVAYSFKICFDQLTCENESAWSSTPNCSETYIYIYIYHK